MEVIAKGITNARFSKKVAGRVARGKLHATSVNGYDGKWRIFTNWCSKYKINPWKSSIWQIAEFLLHLFEGGKLKVRTILKFIGQREQTPTCLAL